MVNFSITGPFILSFAKKTCQQYTLSDEQTQTLTSMIEKMCNFCVDSPQEEPIVQRAQVPSSPRAPERSNAAKVSAQAAALKTKLEKKARLVKHLIEKASDRKEKQANDKSEQ